MQNKDGIHDLIAQERGVSHAGDDGLVDRIREVLEEYKAQDLLVIPSRIDRPYSETVVLCTATSSRHVRTLCEKVRERIKGREKWVPRVEGGPLSTWVLVDVGSVVVHCMTAEARSFYRLEELLG